MLKGLVIHQGTTLNAAWTDRMIIDSVPVSIQPVGASATAVSGGSLSEPVTYYYKITSIGINGESIGSAEVSASTTSVNKTIDIAWTAQTYVTRYIIYRGTASGIYLGTTIAYTNSLVDDGTLSWNTMGVNSFAVFPNTPPTSTTYVTKTISTPTSNSIHGTQTTLSGTTWNGKRSTIFFGQLTVKGYTFIPQIQNDTDFIPQVSKLHLSYKNKDFSFDMKDVIVPSNWNTPNSDAGIVQAIADLETWITAP